MAGETSAEAPSVNATTGSRTAARLREKKEQILQEWAALVRAHCPAARSADEPTLIDTMPLLLEQIAEGLESGDPKEKDGRQAEPLGGSHGRERATQTDYDLEQLVEEYRYFRQVLLRELEKDTPLPIAERDLILDLIQVSVRASVATFSSRVNLEREQMAAALRQAHDRLAERLHHAEEHFRSLVEGVEDYAIFMLDAEGIITSWNAGAQRMIGYSAEEIIGEPFSLLYPEEGRRRDEPSNHLRTAAIEGRFRGEGQRVKKGGAIYMADVLLTAMREDGRLIGFSKVVQDLTESNELMQERDLSRSHARRLEIEAQVRDRFVATLTHDLRSPLSTALTAAELISRFPERIDRVLVWCQRLQDAVRRADRMICDLLDATQVQAGEKMRLELSPCDIRGLAEEVCAEQSSRHGDRFHLDITGDTTGVWSAAQLHRVLDNLLSNAVKYGEPATPITIGLRRVDDRMLLSVHNHGTIIPAEDQPKLFEPFHRTAAATTSGKTGWGLGLALVRSIVEAHGGIVSVRSTHREGTTFTVDLPIDARPQTAPETPGNGNG